ncbi:MAG TPA: tyrosine-type recombinase/integrase [Gemmataceae bacterium]|nr:tyrosine-type recombinase/integrase [Gemmataceae bacterium]
MPSPVPDLPALPALRRVAIPAHERVPAAVAEAGPAGQAVWEEFFAASLRNPHTRVAYCRAARGFFLWPRLQGIALHDIRPAQVAEYFDQLGGSPATRKLHLAALRRLFDLFVTRHLMVLNPAACVRGERYEVIEGKTPEITPPQTRRLIESILTTRTATEKPSPGQPPKETVKPCPVGLRDRAICAVLLYTAARAGAVAKLRRQHFAWDGSQWTLRFEEKGGKSREIPVRHDLQKMLLAYLDAAGLADAPRDTPLFPTAYRASGRLTARAITGADICRMVKRRLKTAGLPTRLSPHSFRVTTVTDLLTQGVPLEDVAYLAGHSDPRTTRLYDRRQRRVTRNIVERISITIAEEPKGDAHD